MIKKIYHNIFIIAILFISACNKEKSNEIIKSTLDNSNTYLEINKARFTIDTAFGTKFTSDDNKTYFSLRFWYLLGGKQNMLVIKDLQLDNLVNTTQLPTGAFSFGNDDEYNNGKLNQNHFYMVEFGESFNNQVSFSNGIFFPMDARNDDNESGRKNITSNLNITKNSNNTYSIDFKLVATPTYSGGQYILHLLYNGPFTINPNDVIDW